VLKPLKFLAPFLGLLLMPATSSAYEKWLGRLTSANPTAVNASTTAVPFYPISISPGSKLAIQCDAAAYYLAGNGNAIAVTSTAGSSKGVVLQAQSLFDVPIDTSVNDISVLSVSGTANCDVYQVLP
jgi:hypothetical protein